MKHRVDFLSIGIICLLCITTVCGILSLDFTKGYDIVNQYGDTVKIFGSGIYSNDSYFKAPISIGTDFCILFVLVPMLIVNLIKKAKDDSNINRLKLMSLYSVVLYYSASISLGVTYNKLHLIYIMLLGCSLFGMFFLYRKIDISVLDFKASKGIKIFLIVSGIALIVAWMPDIIPTLFNGKSLNLIEVYTTEITYVLDMGIIAPMLLICLYLLKKNDNLATVILAISFKLCIIIGIMMIPQTICQLVSGADLPIPVIITKSASFSVLAGFSYYFNRKLYGILD